MNRGYRSGRSVLVLLGAMFLLGIITGAALGENLQVHPALLKITGFFGGARLEVSGDIPGGTEAVIEVIGRVTEQELMRKGRRWDLWMNVGEINIGGIPGFYLVATSDPRLLSPDNKVTKPWGYGLWQRRARFQGALK